MSTINSQTNEPVVNNLAHVVGSILILIAIIPAFNIAFRMGLSRILCTPREDLLTGLFGLCEYISFANLMLFITGWQLYFNLFGAIILVLGIALAWKKIRFFTFKPNTSFHIFTFVLVFLYATYFSMQLIGVIAYML